MVSNQQSTWSNRAQTPTFRYLLLLLAAIALAIAGAFLLFLKLDLVLWELALIAVICVGVPFYMSRVVRRGTQQRNAAFDGLLHLAAVQLALAAYYLFSKWIGFAEWHQISTVVFFLVVAFAHLVVGGWIWVNDITVKRPGWLMFVLILFWGVVAFILDSIRS